MKKWFHLIIAVCFCLILASCAGMPNDTLTQVSTIDAILAGVYEGQLTMQELREYGDFGIGTFEGLDGEMVILDGKIFQIREDGKVYYPDNHARTPFASVANFQAEFEIDLLPDSDYQTVTDAIDQAIAKQNLFQAVKITGLFGKIKTRSVPAQSKPYPPLIKVTKTQPEFEMEDISGTLVGFKSPAFVKGLGVPGYHLHFISDDLQSGGHLLSFTLKYGKAKVDLLNRFSLNLPRNIINFDNVDFDRDRSAGLEKAEKE